MGIVFVLIVILYGREIVFDVGVQGLFLNFEVLLMVVRMDEFYVGCEVLVGRICV